jgi:hypothetical protein
MKFKTDKKRNVIDLNNINQPDIQNGPQSMGDYHHRTSNFYFCHQMRSNLTKRNASNENVQLFQIKMGPILTSKIQPFRVRQ